MESCTADVLVQIFFLGVFTLDGGESGKPLEAASALALLINVLYIIFASWEGRYVVLETLRDRKRKQAQAGASLDGPEDQHATDGLSGLKTKLAR